VGTSTDPGEKGGVSMDLSSKYEFGCSIVLPTYNRAAFLHDALKSIEAQTYHAWQLIVVDDGSTDDTPQVLSQWQARHPGRICCIRQSNTGPAAARNTGLAHAKAPYVAFFDSDDLWLPEHLARCVEVLAEHEEVDWIYAAARIDDMTTMRNLQQSSFYQDGKPRRFLRLRTRQVGDAYLIDDTDALACAIEHGLYCGLQGSVIRRCLFESLRFDERFHWGEDQLLSFQALAHGFGLAYLDEVQLVYRVHGENLSLASTSVASDQRREVIERLAAVFHAFAGERTLSTSEQRALDRRLFHESFWNLGYQGLWRRGRSGEAIDAFRRGLQYWPWSLRAWKTYLLARGKRAIGFDPGSAGGRPAA
jgi:glycosyltransferase involved in cell wall biosynthesis